MRRTLIVCTLACWALLCAASASARTWFVEADSSRASDLGPGTEARPLLTISEAMRRLEVGDTVVIGSGIYRETVVVPKLSPSEGRLTTIRARSAAQAVIRGSDTVTGWQPMGEGRFGVDWSDRPAPAQMYLEGVPLRQIAGTVFGGYPTVRGHELAPSHASEGGIWLGRVAGDVSSLRPGDFIYDSGIRKLVVRLAAGIEPGTKIEVSTRPFVFLAEDVSGLRLEGLAFEHANTSELARQGAVKVFGNNNVLSGLSIRRMDAIGLQLFGIGSSLLDSSIEDCGQMALNARGHSLTIARNRILRNNTRGFNKWWEAGGMKMIGEPGFHDSFIRDNVVAFNRGDGIWIDWMNSNVRISGNVSAFNDGFGIHYEASQKGWIDGNASYGNGQRGIYLFESSDTLVQGNLVLANGLEGIVIADGERSGRFPPLKPIRNRVLDNVIAWNKDVELMLPLPGSQAQSDGNLFIAAQAPGMVEGWTALTNRPARGLAAWRQRSGTDGRSREMVAPRPMALNEVLRERRLLSFRQLSDIVDARPNP